MGGKSLTNAFGSLTAGTLSSGTLTNNGGNYDLQNGTVSAVLAGTNGVNKTTSGTVTLTGNNTYTGATTVSAGTLTISGGAAIADTGTVSLANTSGVAFNVNSSETIASLQGGGATGGNVTIASGQTLTVAEANTNTFSGSLQGAGNFTKSGLGTLTLNGANTNSGAVSVTGGTVLLSGASALSNSASRLSAASGTTISLADGVGRTITLSSGNLSLTSATMVFELGSTSDRLTLTSGAVTLSGTNTISLANLGSFSAGNYTLISAASGLNTGGTWSLNSTGGPTGFTFSLTSNATTLTLSASSTTKTWNGGSATSNNWRTDDNWGGAAYPVTGDDIVFAGGNRTTSVNNNNGTTQMLWAKSITFDSTAASFALGGALGGQILGIRGDVINNSVNTQTFSWTSPTYTLGLDLQASIAINTAAGGIIFNSALSGNNSSYSLTKSGAYTLTFNGTNTYTGETKINAGNLTISSGSAISDSGVVTLGNATGAILHVAASETIGTLSGGGSNGGDISIAASQALTVNQTSTGTFAGVISGSGGLTKNGTGTLTLSAANTYTGATTVNAGTLQAAATGALANSTVINVNGGSFLVTAENAVNDNAAINLGGGRMAVSGNFNETVGLLTLSANSIIDLAGYNGTLRFSGVGSWAVGTNLAIWNWNGINQYGTPVGDGANNRHVVFADATGLDSYLDRISFYSGSGTGFSGNGFEQGFSGGGTEIIAVPETETYFYAVALLGGVVVQYLRRRAERNPLGHRPA